MVLRRSAFIRKNYWLQVGFFMFSISRAMAKWLEMQAILSAFTATHTKRKKYLLSFSQGFIKKLIRKLHQKDEFYEFEQGIIFLRQIGIRHLRFYEFFINKIFASTSQNSNISFCTFFLRLKKKKNQNQIRNKLLRKKKKKEKQ